MNTKENRLVLCKDDIHPDSELLRWEKWIEIRKEEAGYLACKTKRTQAQLVMNKLKDIREQKEQKTVLEHAKIEKKCGVRKTIWEQPARLKQHCYNDPVYEVHRTRAEVGRPRVIEHIGVPRYIRENECGMAGDDRKKYIKLEAQYKIYKENKEKELDINIKKIEPFRSRIDDLIVIGTKPKPPKEKINPLPINIISNYEDIRDALHGVYACRINDTVVFKDVLGQNLIHLKEMQLENWHISCNSWSYYFNCPLNRIGRSKCLLYNLGTVSLRYCWKQIKRHDEDNHPAVFFFNNNENVIFPGQKQEILFTFLSSEPGAYEESWELYFLNTIFLDTREKQFIIELYADSVENVLKIKKKVEKLQNMIHFTSLKNIAKDLLSEIFTKATSIEPSSYPYKKKLLEAEMFVMKNPVCYYHQSEVHQLKEIFSEITLDKEWDLAITTWRNNMMDKSFDERFKYFSALKDSHRRCLKPCLEDYQMNSDHKYKAVQLILGRMADNFDTIFDQIVKTVTTNDRSQLLSISEKYTLENVDEKMLTAPIVRNIFYMRCYENVSSNMELCAGVLSSLELNRWIDFDFCRM